MGGKQKGGNEAMFGETQCKLVKYSEALKSVLSFYGSVTDGEVEASEELKTALQTTIKELSKTINQTVDKASIKK